MLQPRLQAAIFVLIHKRHNLGNNLEQGSYTVLAPVPHSSHQHLLGYVNLSFPHVLNATIILV